MTDQEINTAIAEVCRCRFAIVHDYVNCHRARLEAERSMTKDESDYFHKKYERLLFKKSGKRDFYTFDQLLTGRQEAELFLEAIRNCSSSSEEGNGSGILQNREENK